MSYRYDESDGSIVIEGFENGIGDSPYSGLSDMRNMNIVSIPGEASVAFSTTSETLPVYSGTVISADAGADTITFSGTAPTGQMAVVFAGGALPTGISAGTQSASTDTNVYWIFNVTATTFQIATAPGSSSPVNIGGTGTGTFTSIDMGKPMWFETVNSTYMVDANGRAWYNPSTSWIFLGNTTRTNASGNGIIAYRSYLFIYRNARIDYMPIGSIGTWVYGWTPASGSSGGAAMVTGAGVNNPHPPLVGQDDVVYYPDSNYVGSFFEKVGSTFDPTNTATYTYAQKALTIPSFDTAQCLAELGVNLLVGGAKNAIYPWNRTATSFTYPILIADTNIVKMLTVNTNTYIFAGSRGRIYYTNGSQAQLFKKVPDSLSNTVEPYFVWGGVAFARNQIFFGIQATTNTGNAINQYGGVWAIDLDSKAIRLINKLSYATYAGIASAIRASSAAGAAGFGLYVGWDSGASTYGVDVSSTNPYTGGQSILISDLVPIGTYLSKRTFNGQCQYKLSAPLVSGESVAFSISPDLITTFSNLTAQDSASQVGQISGYFNIPLQKLQWLRLQVVLTSTASTPSYVRLKEIRIK